VFLNCPVPSTTLVVSKVVSVMYFFCLASCSKESFIIVLSQASIFVAIRGVNLCGYVPIALCRSFRLEGVAQARNAFLTVIIRSLCLTAL